MVKDDSKEFNFDSVEDEEDAGELYREELKDLRVEKINQRVTIITILIPCLIGVVLYIAYRDLTGRVTQSEFSGSKEVQALSEELEKKFADLAAQNATFQAALNEKITFFEKTTRGLNDTLKKINASVQKLKQNENKTQTSLKAISASKADKKDQAAEDAKINKKIVSIRKELEALAAIRKDLDALTSEHERLDKNTKSASESNKASFTKANDDIKQIQNNLTILEDQIIDKESLQALLDLERFKAKKINKLVIDQAVEAIEKKLDTLAKRTKLLEQNLKQLEQTPTKIPFAKPPPKTKSTNSDDILDEDIKE